MDIFNFGRRKEPKVDMTPMEKPEKTPQKITKMIRIKEMAPGDKPPSRGKRGKVTTKELFQLRELMRQRYALDLQIWDLRKARPGDRKIVEEKMKKADALLAQIRALVLSMDHRDYFKSDVEYRKLKEIRTRILAGEKRHWVKNSPWDEE